jgi:hypothetical protein
MEFIYIVSTSYSGSTLLTFLLATHSQVATIGELKVTALGDIDRYDCSCGVRIHQCAFWQRLGQELKRRGTALDFTNMGTHFRRPDRPLLDRVMRARVRGPLFEALRTFALRLLPGAPQAYAQILARNKLLVDVVEQLRRPRVFLDGSKDPIRLKYLAEAKYWPIKAIHLIRDGRANSASLMNHENLSMETAAYEWRRTHEECEQLKRYFPQGSWFTLHYEALCRNSPQMVDALFRFIGLDPGQVTLDFRSIEHHILGNSMRLDATSAITVDERWRTTLQSHELAVFERIAGHLNRRYGYTT